MSGQHTQSSRKAASASGGGGGRAAVARGVKAIDIYTQDPVADRSSLRDDADGGGGSGARASCEDNDSEQIADSQTAAFVRRALALLDEAEEDLEPTAAATLERARQFSGGGGGGGGNDVGYSPARPSYLYRQELMQQQQEQQQQQLSRSAREQRQQQQQKQQQHRQRKRRRQRQQQQHWQLCFNLHVAYSECD